MMIHSIDGVILAGGLSRRMGVDKAMLLVNGKTLLFHQIEMMLSEVEQLFIASRDLPLPKCLENIAVVEDVLVGSEGPLSGISAAMAESSADCLWVMSCDNYGFTADLKYLLLEALETKGADIVYVKNGDSSHPLLAVIRNKLNDDLSAFLSAGGRSVFKWYATQNTVTVEFEIGNNCYSNINTPEDYQALLRALQ